MALNTLQGSLSARLGARCFGSNSAFLDVQFWFWDISRCVGAVLAHKWRVGLICFQLPVARLVGALRMVKPAESAVRRS